MPFSMRRFQELVDGANWHFAWFKESSLAPLITALGGVYDTRRGDDPRDLRLRGREVRAAIARIDETKQTKYFRAFDYLGDALDDVRYRTPMHGQLERESNTLRRMNQAASEADGIVMFVNRARRSQRFGNCALCAVARLLRTDTLRLSPDQSDEFFGDYARRQAVPRGAAVAARYVSLVDQLNGIERLLTERRFRTSRIGDVEHFLDSDTLVRTMSADPQGTEYIVYLQYGGAGYAGHYNYAIMNGRPRFFDFQQDYPGSPGGTTEGFKPLWPRDEDGDVADVDSDAPANCIAIRAVR